MASLADVFKDKERTNWLKAWLAIDIAKSGLEHFADNEAHNFHQHIYSQVTSTRKSPLSTCTSCTTDNVWYNNQCPMQICNKVCQKINNEHRYKNNNKNEYCWSWKNTSAELWQTNYWEIAKCFFPPDGYAATSSIQDTDFNGVVSFLLNCKHFDSKFSFPITKGTPTQRPACLLYEAREIGKAVRHSSKMKVTDVELNDYFMTLSSLLSDSRYLRGDSDAQNAVKKLAELKKDTLLLTTAEMKCLLEAVDSTLKKHLKDVAKDVVDESVNELRENTELCIEKIKDYMVTIKEELAKEAELHKQDIDKNAKKSMKDYNELTVLGKKDFDGNAVKRTQAFDDNSEKRTQEYDEHTVTRTQAFDENAEKRTQEYDEHTVTRTQAFDDNSEKRTQEYDEHTVTRTQAFDDNSEKRTQEYDEHTVTRTQAFDKNAEKRTQEYDELTVSRKKDFDENADKRTQNFDEIAEKRLRDINEQCGNTTFTETSYKQSSKGITKL
ncbi:uncharacterized protein LOC127841393 [Dreissena polymorpha]|uniref:uncharacterized protein LOC127841393 n=1 Tax=Dreissena polymorpha TaxID=45954 RepID=UPI00226460B1|nr:uncharacterized protein LOC127841393 [Dreissena polymorpha]